MKKKVWICILIFLVTASIFASDITAPPYGNRIVYDTDIETINENIVLPLSFSLADIQSYEFGFTQDDSVSLRSQTTAISTLALSRDEEEEAKPENNGKVIASASFKVYWKVVSGYNLKFYLSASGAFSSGGNDTVDYSIYDIGENIVLGYGRAVSNNVYTTPSEVGSFTPDYEDQDFAVAGSSSFRIVTRDDLQDAFDGQKSSYYTDLVISVEVTN